ncbi:helix-turn-helix transcriptional regulator [Culicoidibacter larvae]|uniref:YafY family transcriptional regulator n=1 Tax=Culicoidibacter larvae TaxID=2579976 RepID=A0A5R8Q8T9_9FIRM|nr:YafY family protein [Culicoidibacter larvae]TLG72121.1 YafY family transcriptional regulator [Culicoidibacter larvae]
MKVDRLVSIIMLLMDKKRVSAHELAEQFEVSPRTIYRDIDSINMAGVPIMATPGVSGGIEIMPNYKLDNKVFSLADLSAILIGLASVANMTRATELNNAIAKVKNLIPPEKAKEIEVKANQIYIDLSPWMSNENMQPYLAIIKTALQENKLLSFDYTDRYGNKTARTAEPYQLVLKGNQWYWQGYCNQRNDYRLFRLSRMSDLQLQEQTFTPRDYQKPQLDFTDILATMQTKITLRIHKSISEQVLDYCTYDHFTPDGDEHYIVSFPFIENDYYYNILFGFGNKCICIEPSHVRSEMKRRINEMTTLYGS